jgi:hypothetical protein
VRLPECGDAKRSPAPVYAPATAPVLTGYSDSQDPFGGTTGPNSTTLFTDAVSVKFVPVTFILPAATVPTQSSSSSPAAATIVISPIFVPVAPQQKGPVMAGSQVLGTVTQASPLWVVVDGATVASPADSLNSVAYVLNARVIVQIRNPQVPLVMGSPV